MAKRGRRQDPGLRYDKANGWYRRIEGKKRYFGHDETEAYRRWARVELEQGLGELDDLAPYLRKFGESIERIKDQQVTPAFAQTFTSVAHSTATGLAEEVERVTTLKDDQDASEAPRVSDAIRVYLDSLRNKSDSHRLDATPITERFLEHLGGDRPLHDLTHNDFVSWRRKWDDQVSVRAKWRKQNPKARTTVQLRNAPGLSPNHATKHVVIVKTIFNRASELANLEFPGMFKALKTLKTFKTPPTDRDILTRDHFAKLLDAADDRWRAILLVALNGAFGNTDVADFLWDHIENNVVDFPRGKNGNPRRFTLWDETREALAKLPRHGRNVFSTVRGDVMVRVSKGETKATKDKKTNKPKGKENKRDAVGSGFATLVEEAGLLTTREFAVLNEDREQIGTEEREVPIYTFSVIRKSTSTVAVQYGASNELSAMILADRSGRGETKSYNMAHEAVVDKWLGKVRKHYLCKIKGGETFSVSV